MIKSWVTFLFFITLLSLVSCAHQTQSTLTENDSMENNGVQAQAKNWREFSNIR